MGVTERPARSVGKSVPPNAQKKEAGLAPCGLRTLLRLRGAPRKGLSSAPRGAGFPWLVLPARRSLPSASGPSKLRRRATVSGSSAARAVLPQPTPRPVPSTGWGAASAEQCPPLRRTHRGPWPPTVRGACGLWVCGRQREEALALQELRGRPHCGGLISSQSLRSARRRGVVGFPTAARTRDRKPGDLVPHARTAWLPRAGRESSPGRTVL